MSLQFGERRPGGNRPSFDMAGQVHPVWFLVLLIAGIVLWGISTCFFTVETQGQAIVKRFGKVVATKGPGLHFKLPFGIETQTFVPTEKVLKHEFGFASTDTSSRRGSSTFQKTSMHQEESLMLTGDLKVIDLEWVVQFRINDPNKYLHRVQLVDKTIRDISESVNRRIVGNSLGTDVLTVNRVQIAQESKRELQEILDSFDMGVTISTIELQDVTPPDPVKPAFNEINQAEQEKERFINEAEKYRNQMVPRAKGEARQVVEAAEGYRAERVNKAKGEAAAFAALVEEYRHAPDVTRRRLYLEMLDEVMPNLGRVLVVEPGQSSPIPFLNLDAAGNPLAPSRSNTGGNR